MYTDTVNGARARSRSGPLGLTALAGIVLSAISASPADAERRWYFRMGVLHARAQVTSLEIVLPLNTVSGTPFAAGVAPDAILGVEPLTLVGGNIGYILPVLNDRLAVETLVAIPRNAKVVAAESLANKSILPTVFGIPTGIPPLGSSLVEVSAAAPIFTVVYRLPTLGPVTPIVGAGVVALFSADIQITNPLLERYISAKFEVKPTLGRILEAGADVHLWSHVQARIDLKYISVSADTEVNDIQLRSGLSLIGNVDLGNTVIKASAHAWLAQLGVGFDL